MVKSVKSNELDILSRSFKISDCHVVRIKIIPKMTKSGQGKGFSYVFVPCDTTCAMEERWFPHQVSLESDEFVELLKTHFGAFKSDSPDVEMLKAQIKSKNANALNNVSDEMMQRLAQMTTIDIFPVLLPLKDTNYKGVSIYVDDKGVSKNLPLNQRVTGLAVAAGKLTMDQYAYMYALVCDL